MNYNMKLTFYLFSQESDMYMRCEAAPNTAQPANIYNLNGGVSDADV